jgi:oligopeptide transport system substrate-binding protein
VGNGPYVVHRWRFKRDVRLARNPHFRDPSLARADTIGVLFIEEQNTALLAFQSGAADWHSDLEVGYIGDLLEEVRAGRRRDVRAFDAFGTYFWSFNCAPRFADGRENPFHDARVRRAFALAVDKAMLVERVRRGAERPARAFIPPRSIPGYEGPAGLAFDLDRAREEIRRAGWEDRDGDGLPENPRGEEFPTVELLCTPVGPHRDVAQALAGIWERALGVRSKVIVRETKVYRASLKQQDFMVARGAWFGDYLDPTTFLDIHRTGDGNNDRAFSEPRYDALLKRADSVRDPRERLAALADAERLLVEEGMPLLPLWHYAQYYLCRPEHDEGGLQGLSTHPRLIQYPSSLSVNRTKGAR